MHPIAALQLIMMVEEDLDRIRRGERPHIEYIWRGGTTSDPGPHGPSPAGSRRHPPLHRRPTEGRSS